LANKNNGGHYCDDESTRIRAYTRLAAGERTGGRDFVLSEHDGYFPRLFPADDFGRTFYNLNTTHARATSAHRYASEGGLEFLGLLVLGLIALEDALDVRAEDALVRIELPQLLVEPGVERVRRDRHRSSGAF